MSSDLTYLDEQIEKSSGRPFSADSRDWRDESGLWWREIISFNLGHLKALRNDYEARGQKTYLYPFDRISNRFALTIRDVR